MGNPHALVLHRPRADRAAVAATLKQWLQAHEYTELAAYRAALAEVAERERQNEEGGNEGLPSNGEQDR